MALQLRDLRPLGLTIVTMVLSLSTGCQRLQQGHLGALRGGVRVADEHNTVAASPTKASRSVYVTDFELDTARFQGDQGVRGMVPGVAKQGALAQVGQNLPHPFATDDPSSRASQIVDTMADALVDDLRDQGFTTERLSPTSSALPTDGWLIKGVFTEVDEGNRFKRAIVGFGQGASTMQVQVGISDLSSAHPTEPFIVFGTVKDPSKMPGAAVTMNPYVAAAKFLMEKNATEKDIRNTAEQIDSELVRYRDTIKREAEKRRSP